MTVKGNDDMTTKRKTIWEIAAEPHTDCQDLQCGFTDENLTDVDNGHRFADRFGHCVRFCAKGGWFVHNGEEWNSADEESEIYALMKATLKDMTIIMKLRHDDDDSGKIAKWIKRSGNLRRFKAALTMAKSEIAIRISPAQNCCDRKPGCSGCVLARHEGCFSVDSRL